MIAHMDIEASCDHGHGDECVYQFEIVQIDIEDLQRSESAGSLLAVDGCLPGLIWQMESDFQECSNDIWLDLTSFLEKSVCVLWEGCNGELNKKFEPILYQQGPPHSAVCELVTTGYTSRK